MNAERAFRPCAVIPVYNHPDNVGEVVAQVRRHGLPVVLADDGSEPVCAGLLERLAAADDDVVLLRLAVNTGKGGAVLAGASTALRRGFSHVLQIDADGQHDTGAIAAALAQAESHPTALVLGLPVFDASMPRARRYGRWATHIFVWINSCSLAIRDAMCGFRVYPLIQLLALTDRQKVGLRMEFDIEIAVRLRWDNVAVKSVPVGVRYPAGGISHFDLWRDNLRIARTHALLLFGMLLRLPLLLWQRLADLVRA